MTMYFLVWCDILCTWHMFTGGCFAVRLNKTQISTQWTTKQIKTDNNQRATPKGRKASQLGEHKTILSCTFAQTFNPERFFIY